MNKGELIDAVAGISRIVARGRNQGSRRGARQHFTGDTRKRWDSVSLVGFRNVLGEARAARAGRNPRTGETIQNQGQSNVPGFKAGKGLKDAVN